MEKNKNITNLEINRGQMKILVYLIGIILLIGIALAQATGLGTFQKGSCVNLVQSCSACTTNKITSVLYPDSSVAMGTVTMSTTDSIYYNYTFCNTTVLGQYIVNGYGDVDGVDTNWVYDFNVVPVGYVEEISNTDLNYIGTILLMILVLAFSLFIYLKISRYLGGVLVMLTGIGILSRSPQNGWVGIIIMLSGFLLIVYTAFTPKKRHHR